MTRYHSERPGSYGSNADEGNASDAVALRRSTSELPFELGDVHVSTGKVTSPGEKSVRRIDQTGQFEQDILALREENIRGVEHLYELFEDGSLVYSLPTPEESRDRTRKQLGKLPREFRPLRDPAEYSVHISNDLESMTQTVRNDLVTEYHEDR